MGPEDFRTLAEYPEYEINSGGMVRNRHRQLPQVRLAYN